MQGKIQVLESKPRFDRPVFHKHIPNRWLLKVYKHSRTDGNSLLRKSVQRQSQNYNSNESLLSSKIPFQTARCMLEKFQILHDTSLLKKTGPCNSLVGALRTISREKEKKNTSCWLYITYKRIWWNLKMWNTTVETTLLLYPLSSVSSKCSKICGRGHLGKQKRHQLWHLHPLLECPGSTPSSTPDACFPLMHMQGEAGGRDLAARSLQPMRVTRM